MKYIFPFIFLFLHGCATFSPLFPTSDPVTQVDAYIEKQEFSQALSLIAATADNDPLATELNKRHKEILIQIEEFEHQTVSAALNQERNSDWLGAKNTYKDALKKLHHSKILEKEQEAMLERFHFTMKTLESEKLILTGQWLKEILPIQQSLHENDPGDIGQEWSYSNIKSKAEETAQELLELGKEEFAINNLAMAQRLLPLSVALHPSPEGKAIVEELEKIVHQRNEQKQESSKKIQKKKNKQIIDAFNKAMALGKLKEARKQLARLPASVRNRPSIDLMQERLNKTITAKVAEELAMGESFYRAGRYDQALKVWQHVLELVPEHSAVQAKIDRTQKVISKLKALKQKQKANK